VTTTWFWVLFGSGVGILSILVIGLLVWINSRNGR